MPAVMPINYVEIDCCECGLMFLVPKTWMDRRQKDGRGFRCPNGHKMFYPAPASTPKPDDDKEVERRRELVLALHRAEQAEARAADGKPPVEEQPTPPGSCPHCGKVYKLETCLRRHVRRYHATEVA